MDNENRIYTYEELADHMEKFLEHGLDTDEGYNKSRAIISKLMELEESAKMTCGQPQQAHAPVYETIISAESKKSSHFERTLKSVSPPIIERKDMRTTISCPGALITIMNEEYSWISILVECM